MTTTPDLEEIPDLHVRLSLELQQAFGLRREVAIKFRPGFADRGDHSRLKAAWTKGRKSRTLPVRTPGQRDLLELIRCLEETEAEHLLEAAERHGLQALIMSLSDDRAGAAHDLLYQRPRMTVLGLAADGRSADLFFLQPRKERLGELTPATFIQALRSVGADV